MKNNLKTNKNKKSQLKIQEMAFMLVAVVFFFILVGLFALSIFYVNLYKQANKISEDRTISAMVSLADTPELSCVTSKSNCIDADKLISLVGNEPYKRFWTFSSLRIIRQQAFQTKEADMEECNMANYPDCESFLIYDKEVESERKVSSYVALCRKEIHTTEIDSYTYERCELAKIIAGTEIKVQRGDDSI